MRVKVDRNACIGAGQCVRVAPEVFDQDDEEGLVVLRQERPAQEHRDATRRAANLCPALAIIVDEGES